MAPVAPVPPGGKHAAKAAAAKAAYESGRSERPTMAKGAYNARKGAGVNPRQHVAAGARGRSDRSSFASTRTISVDDYDAAFPDAPSGDPREKKGLKKTASQLRMV